MCPENLAEDLVADQAEVRPGDHQDMVTNPATAKGADTELVANTDLIADVLSANAGMATNTGAVADTELVANTVLVANAEVIGNSDLDDNANADDLAANTNIRVAVPGATYLMIDDGDELLAACRQAGITCRENHRIKLAALGLPVCVQCINPDGTLLCQEPSTGNYLWLPISALNIAEAEDIT